MTMSEAWGAPPWIIERECSARWALAFAERKRREAREMERAMKRARRQHG